MVSICIPTYNGAKYLESCITSAINQTYKDVEIIIVDDQSSDHTLGIIKKFQNKYATIKLFINNTNLGLVGNWNKCIEVANGEWIKFLFQDDILNNDCIEKMLSSNHGESKLIVCNRKFIFSDNIEDQIKFEYNENVLSIEKAAGIKNPAYIDKNAFATLIAKFVNTNFIGEPTSVMFKKSVVEILGGFDTNMVQTCDLEYWYRLGSNFGLYYIPQTLCCFRVHGDSMSAANKVSQKDLVDKFTLTHHLLYSIYYKNLRDNLSLLQQFKIKQMFLVRIYEVELLIRNNSQLSSLASHYNKIRNNLSVKYSANNISFFTKALFFIVAIRRKAKSIFK